MFNKIYDKLKNYIKANYKFFISLICIFLLFYIKLPYVIYTPGGSIYLEDRIEIEGSYEEEGQMGMAYVSMIKGSIPMLLLSYVIPNWDIIPSSTLTYEGESVNEMIDRDRVYMEESMSNAIVAAFSLTDKTWTIEEKYNEVDYIDERAKTDLKVGDILIKADEIEIDSMNTLRNYVATKNIGDIIDLEIKRNNKNKNVSIEVIELNGNKKIGISFVQMASVTTDPEVVIESKASESGPSGGLMMSLAIYNKITEEDITKGRKIIGTGTIDAEGNVGEIGGIKYKLLGAINEKADIFICPKENYEEAMKVKEKEKSDIKIIEVGTLKEAIEKLMS